MPSVVFVHGTGVRQPAYDDSLNRIKMSVAQFRNDLNWVPCYWGGEHGATLNLAGNSIPGYDTTRSVGAPIMEPDELGEWSLLYDDPLVELRLLASRNVGEVEYPPGGGAPWQPVADALQRFTPSAVLYGLLDEASLLVDWTDAYRTVAEFPQLIDALSRAPEIRDAGDGYDALRELIARAIVAGLSAAAAERGAPALDAPARNALVTVIRAQLGATNGQTRGLLTNLGRIVSAPIVALGARTGTWWVRRKRGSMSDAMVPFPGDILYYQTRGERIRSFIRQVIEHATPPVYVLAHSLGGIASFELLATPDAPHVAGFVTAGSQAALMYEIDCLPQIRLEMEAAPDARLPASFPKWLNFYDVNDFLGYVVQPVFGQKAEDVEILSGQPFPEAHSAYWSTSAFAKRFSEFVR